MANNNVQNVRFLRNGSPYVDRATALNELNKQNLSIEQDGSLILARYGSGDNVKTLVGVVYAKGSNKSITIIDIEGALAEIAGEIDAMDLAVVSGDGEVITAVSENDGKVSASKTAIKDVKLTGYVKDASKTGAISANDDVEDALSKLENKIGSNAITNADGSITVTPANGSTTDVKVHIKEGEKVIKLDANEGGIYTDIKIASATPSSTTVKEEYNLLDSDGNALGTSIKIYKDSHIVSITYITDSGSTYYQNLEYKYIDADGVEQTEYVDISSLVLEAEFQSGVTATDHVVHGVVDSTSEKDSKNNSFLTVGTNGFKVDGIKGEIDAKIDALDATVGSTSVDSGKHVAVQVVEDAGVLTTLTVTEDNIANKTDLDTLSGKAVTAVVMTGGTANIVNNDSDNTKKITINTDGSQILMTGYAKGSDSGAVATGDSINVAIGKLENQIASKVDALDATVSGETDDGKVKVQVVQDNGVLTAVTVTGTNIASDSALTAEIAARKAVDGQDGPSYAANTSANYINNATSLNDADVKLDIALKALDGDVIKGVKVNGSGLTETNNEVNIQISSVAASGTEASPIIVNTDSTGAVTLQILQIDCGEY